MSCLREVENAFNDHSPMGLIKQDVLGIFITSEKTRKAIFARVNEVKKENAQLRSELEEIKKMLGLKNEKISNLDDLPLLQYAQRKTG